MLRALRCPSLVQEPPGPWRLWNALSVPGDVSPKAVAHHEAAHAVATQTLLPDAVKWIAILDDGPGGLRSGKTEPERDESLWVKAKHAIGGVVMSLAGPIAEGKIEGGIESALAHAGKPHAENENGDYAKAIGYAKWGGLEISEEAKSQWEAEAKAFVCANWEEIAGLACELLNHPTGQTPAPDAVTHKLDL